MNKYNALYYKFNDMLCVIIDHYPEGRCRIKTSDGEFVVPESQLKEFIDPKISELENEIKFLTQKVSEMSNVIECFKTIVEYVNKNKI